MKSFRRIADSFLLKTLRDALPALLVTATFLLVYVLVQWNDGRVEKMTRSSACPNQVNGPVFTHSGFTQLDLNQPEWVRLNCYTSHGVKG